MSFPGMTGIGAAASSPKFGGAGVAAGGGVGPGSADPNDPTVKMVQNAMESCYVKTVMSGVVGFGLGGVFGLFMASMAYDTPYHTPAADAAAAATKPAVAGAPAAAGTAGVVSPAAAGTPAAGAATTAPTTAPTTATASKPALSVPKGTVAATATATTAATATTTTTATATATTTTAAATSAGTATQSALLNPTYAAMANVPLRQQLRQGFRDMGSRSWSTAKNFGTVGALFSGIECGIEGLRAKNDITNGVAAGCLTGGILARNAGPQAAAVGCVGFAAFSAAIDAYMRMPPGDD